MIEVKYDTPIEVTEKQYTEITRLLAGCVASKKEGGKYYIKLWLMQFKLKLEHYLNGTN